VLAQEEMSEKDEYYTEKQEKEPCAQGHLVFV
jgi:hypothetical protein